MYPCEPVSKTRFIEPSRVEAQPGAIAWNHQKLAAGWLAVKVKDARIVVKFDLASIRTSELQWIDLRLEETNVTAPSGDPKDKSLHRREFPSGEMGRWMHDFIRELYPICRSITGDGVRQTLGLLARRIPLQTHEVPTGTRAFDWTVPKEWNIRDAYVKDPSGERVIDFKKSNLHVLNYSVPVSARMPLSELRDHLFTLPDHPDWIPYKTSYYRENWGFCLSQNALAALPDSVYEVRIDSSLEDGHLTYGECFLPGRSADEVLLSCHVCHPSLCNDNLSGIALCAALAGSLAGSPLRYSYRFLFIPGTIGAIVWLARNEDHAKRIRHGLVVAGVGDPGPMSYKRSRRGDAEIDRAVVHVLGHRGAPYSVSDFSPYGYDERQYSSPGFDLPVGALSRTPHGRYEQYHTSADDLDFVTAEALAGSFTTYRSVLGVLERNVTYLNLNPKCEPQLGRRGLYRDLGGHAESKTSELAMLWVLNLSDGAHSLLDIAERSELPFEAIETAAGRLAEAGLLRECP